MQQQSLQNQSLQKAKLAKATLAKTALTKAKLATTIKLASAESSENLKKTRTVGQKAKKTP